MIKYFWAEILELSVNVTQDKNNSRIVPCHITLVVNNYEDLNKMLGGVTIDSVVVIPNIHAVLLPKKPAK